VELEKAKRAEEEASRLRRRRTGLAEEDDGGSVGKTEGEDGEDEADEETETETEVEGSKETPLQRLHVRGGPAKIKGVMESAAAARAESSGLQVGSSGEGDATKRRSLGENGDAGSVSTDSEWEKVSDHDR